MTTRPRGFHGKVRTLLCVVLSSPQPGQVSTDYHGEVSALHQQMVSLVTTLLEDNTNCVKQVLVTESAAQLAVWLGRQKANDVLLSHMITFLNDKEDSQLRLCFYENIAGVASFVGWHCSSILKPLLEQGLGDPEELIICRTIFLFVDWDFHRLFQSNLPRFCDIILGFF